MKRLLILVATATLSCNQKVEKEKVSAIDSAIIKLPDSAYVSVNKGFLDKFKPTQDSVLIFSAPQNSIQPIRGSRQIGPQYLKILPAKLAIGNTQNPQVFAISRFRNGQDETVLITQNPGSFSLTSVNLLLYNHKAEGITGFLEVADEAKDPGFKSTKHTVLIRHKDGIKGLMRYSNDIFPINADDPTRPLSTDEYFSIQIMGGKIDTAKATPPQIAEFKSYLTK